MYNLINYSWLPASKQERGRPSTPICPKMWGSEDHIDCVQEKVLSEAEVKESCKYFWSCDDNGDGKLSKHEFINLLAELGLSLRRRSAERAFEIADTSRDGSITFAAFFRTYVRQCSRQIKEILHKNLNVQCGYISKSQCLRVLSMFGCNNPDKYRVDRMMENMRMSKDGWIPIEQFYSFLGVELFWTVLCGIIPGPTLLYLCAFIVELMIVLFFVFGFLLTLAIGSTIFLQ